MSRIDDDTLANLERDCASGLTSSDLVDVCASHGIQLSEATLRKQAKKQSRELVTQLSSIESRRVSSRGVVGALSPFARASAS